MRRMDRTGAMNMEWDEWCGAVMRLEIGDLSGLMRGKRRHKGRKMDEVVCTSGILCIAMAFVPSWVNSNEGILALGCSLPIHWSNFSYLYTHKVRQKMLFNRPFHSHLCICQHPRTRITTPCKCMIVRLGAPTSSHIILPLLRFERLFPDIRE